MFTMIKDFIEKQKCKDLATEFQNELHFRKNVNMEVTLTVMTNYIIDDQLKRTGLLYSPYDKYIQTKVQKLFWEWKDEGIINDMEDFSETTKNWIMAYA